jgi:gamma-glutamyltranspeptidase/glutathione hydrolase
MEPWTRAAGVAAGHPATAAAGLEVLRAGGTAADAAVAATLASCVAETVMTGLAGGGHAIWWDAAAREASLLDCFVSVPGLGAGRTPAPTTELAIAFGEQPVPYAVGVATCAVPGVPAGLDELWRAHGQLPWSDLCAPALALARSGVELPPAHATCLEMLAPVYTLPEGAPIYAPSGTLLAAGERLVQPGLVRALELLADEGAASFYRGTIAAELLALMDERGGLVTAADLEAYAPAWSPPVSCAYADRRVHTRGGLAGVAETLTALPTLRGLTEAERAVVLAKTLAGADANGHTTNVTVVDADGNACVVTTSLGLGSGDWVPGLDLHLNSMLGETELLVDAHEPGARMASMMAPTVVADGAGLELAAGSAGGSRLRSALVQVLAGILDEGLDPAAAIARPRLHPAGHVLHAEPPLGDAAASALVDDGWDVRLWPGLHHYFGGASVVGRSGAGADPRRDGAALTLSGPCSIARPDPGVRSCD